MRQEKVRLLIADDVGVGKTIEAALIARELMDRGTVRRLAVLCPPHLCDQWEVELRDKFGIETVVIQPSRMARLERNLPRGDIGVFQYYRNFVCSIDYLKSGRYRDPFLMNAPDLIIVDEAHGAAQPTAADNAQHQRYEFVRDIAQLPERHLILVTATPHSGIEAGFRSLLGHLNESFNVPVERRLDTKTLLPHVVQRRRKSIERWMGATTAFPEREAVEVDYAMSARYQKLFESVAGYCRESVSTGSYRRPQQRVRYWAAIAILRCILSSPRAAEAMLENRKQRRRDRGTETTETEEDVDSALRPQVLDLDGEEEPPDYAPAAEGYDLRDSEIRRLDEFLREARQLSGTAFDAKLACCIGEVERLLQDGFSPIVYCRFIATADYVAEELQRSLSRRFPDLRVASVTGNDGDERRREKIDDLVTNSAVRVLVATDCLSEGINLQEHFDAVVHYDLPWNPNRLEQREGRIDRFGQKKPMVRTVLLYGRDNQMDLIVLRVLIRKAREIRASLGVAVPVPVESEQVIQALIDSFLLQGRPIASSQMALPLDDQRVSQLHEAMDRAKEREEEVRNLFDHASIQPDEVARELAEMEPVLGSRQDLQHFLANGLQRFNGYLRETKTPGVFELHPGDLRNLVQQRAPHLNRFPWLVAFDQTAAERVMYVGRKHPIVSALADSTLARALEGHDPAFSRCSALYTPLVRSRTAVLLLRFRYSLQAEAPQFAEEVVVAAFRANGSAIDWLQPHQDEAMRLLSEAQPAAPMSPQEKALQVQWALDMLDANPQWWDALARERAGRLEQGHARLRSLLVAAPMSVEAREPDVLGVYVLVPSGR
ncbi:MAG TPA: helicase-related protein [Dehalococcoidia bacterium]|nr:helicase-related protein [Dehalococcoidia bacterium]